MNEPTNTCDRNTSWAAEAKTRAPSRIFLIWMDYTNIWLIFQLIEFMQETAIRLIYGLLTKIMHKIYLTSPVCGNCVNDSKQ